MWKFSRVLPFAALVAAALAQPALAHRHVAASHRAMERHRHEPYWHRRVYAAADALAVSEPDCIGTDPAAAAPRPRWRQAMEPGQCIAPARHYYWSAAQWRYFWHHPSVVWDWTAYSLGY